MAYYDALKTEWASLPAADTTAQKLAAINALSAAGPNKDVSVSSVLGYLALSGKLVTLLGYAASPPPGASASAVVAAKELAALFSTPSFTGFEMSNAAVYAGIENFLTALAGDSNTGIASTDVAALLALAATTVSWWQSAGYSAPITQADLDAAGLS